MKIAIGSDHAAFDLKEIVKEHLINKGHDVIDVGVHEKKRTDYPIFGREVALKVQKGEVERGILICGTGVGIGITANKFRGIRCATVSETYSAKMSVEHNNANVIAFGARVVGDEVAKAIVDTFLDAKYTDHRHQNRIDLITEYERKK